MQVLIHSLDEPSLLRDLCSALVETGGFPLVWIGRAERDAQRSVSILASAGRTEYLFDKIVSWSPDEPTGRGPTGCCLRDQTVQIANDLSIQSSFEPWRARARGFGFGASLSLPLRLGDDRAALVIYAREIEAFDSHTTALLTGLGEELEFGVRHLRMAERERGAVQGTISAVGRMVELRDPYTAGHQASVAELAVAIAQRLRLGTDEVELIRFGALVHDIGKIAVPAEVLTKPSKLTELEYELVRCHAAYGEETLSTGHVPAEIVSIVGQHHERFDGSGYPRGLRGEQISLPARIVAVADVVESMAHDRPYRAGLGIPAALLEIALHRGRLYDPHVADACLALFDEGFSFGPPDAR